MGKIDFVVGGERHELPCNTGEERLLREAKTMIEQEAQTLRTLHPGIGDGQLMFLTAVSMADLALAVKAELRAEQNRVRSLEIALRALREVRSKGAVPDRDPRGKG
jgi:cell division protein ZapA (FtsZ GTPase activity inhibitor)